VTVRVIVNVLGFPARPGVTGEKEQGAGELSKVVQNPENVTPQRSRIQTVQIQGDATEVLVNGIRRFAEGLASERVLATRVRLAVRFGCVGDRSRCKG